MTKPPTDEQIAEQRAKLDAGLKSVGEGIAQLKAETRMLALAAQDLLALVDRNADGEGGPFAINNTIRNSYEFVTLERRIHDALGRAAILRWEGKK